MAIKTPKSLLPPRPHVFSEEKASLKNKTKKKWKFRDEGDSLLSLSLCLAHTAVFAPSVGGEAGLSLRLRVLHLLTSVRLPLAATPCTGTLEELAEAGSPSLQETDASWLEDGHHPCVASEPRAQKAGVLECQRLLPAKPHHQLVRIPVSHPLRFPAQHFPAPWNSGSARDSGMEEAMFRNVGRCANYISLLETFVARRHHKTPRKRLRKGTVNNAEFAFSKFI